MLVVPLSITTIVRLLLLLLLLLLLQQQLLNNELLLSQLFGLLVDAHYRTQPSDLVHLLNDPLVEIFTCDYQQKIVAVALCVKEGQIAHQLAEEIYLGNRRPQGHLLPQSLAMHLGFKNATKLHYLRIIRIAVHQKFQRNGIGSLLTHHMVDNAKQQQLDFIGCSYGATTELLEFWYRMGFETVRVGHTRKASSGMHSVMMLRAISDNGIELLPEVTQQFMSAWLYQLKETQKFLDPAIVFSILNHHKAANYPVPSSQQWGDAYSFALANRTYEDTLASLWEISFFCLQQSDCKTLAADDQHLLINKLLQHQSWMDICQHHHFSGKKQAISQLKSCFVQLIQQFADQQIQNLLNKQ